MRARERAKQACGQEERDWIILYGHHPRVITWLKKNPMPQNWQGTPESWAYCEMPFAPGWWDL